jgi:hypothetical protein
MAGLGDLGPLSQAYGGDDEQQKAALGGSDDSGDYNAGALSTASYAGIPGAAEAFQTMIKGNQEARAALQRARDAIQARKWNRAQALLAMSAAFGQPTRTGSFGESLANVANAVRAPLAERDQLQEQKQKELLGIDTQLAGLDQTTAKAQLDLAALQAKLRNDMLKTPNELVLNVDKDGKPILDEQGKRTYTWAPHPQAVGQVGYTPGGTQLSIDQRAEGAGEKKMAEALADHYNKLQDAAVFEAPSMRDKLDRMRELYTGMGGGKWAPAAADLASIAETFHLHLDPKLGAKQAAEALANEFALTLRNPNEGAGMPGNLSNSDRIYLKSMVPSLATTEEGRRLMFETMDKLIDRKQEIGRLARQYKRDHGGKIDDGLYDMLDDYAEKHPLFGKKEAEQDNASGPSASQAISGAPPPLLARPGVTPQEAPADDEEAPTPEEIARGDYAPAQTNLDVGQSARFGKFRVRRVK